jgi:sugar/nucleoside kinase (ribokinase family)
VYHPAFAVEVVDPLGSGDAFTAGFVDALLRGESLGAACRYGNALGAMVARQEGATRPIELSEVEPFVRATSLGPLEAGLADYFSGELR